MTQNAVFWLRDDFRIEDNPALSYASSNHNTVSALYIYDKSISMIKEKHKSGGFQDHWRSLK